MQQVCSSTRATCSMTHPLSIHLSVSSSKLPEGNYNSIKTVITPSRIGRTNLTHLATVLTIPGHRCTSEEGEIGLPQQVALHSEECSCNLRTDTVCLPLGRSFRQCSDAPEGSCFHGSSPHTRAGATSDTGTRYDYD